MPRPPAAFLLADSHLNHDNIATYCDRPENFTELIIKNCQRLCLVEDTLIHLGDVAIGGLGAVKEMLDSIKCKRKILVRGNHDWHHSCDWWMRHGFDWACDAMIYRGMYLTHKPADALPKGAQWNIHGHLHNIWHGFHPDGKHREDCPRASNKAAKCGCGEGLAEDHTQFKESLKHPWQRLFAVEYTNYGPVEFNHFVSHPDKYFARGLRDLPRKGRAELPSSPSTTTERREGDSQ